MDPKELNEKDIMADISIIRARLDSLAVKLAKPGTRGIEQILAEQETITGTVRQAIQTDARPMSLIAELAGTNYANLTRFVKGTRDLSGATLDKLAAVLGLSLVETAKTKRAGGRK